MRDPNRIDGVLAQIAKVWKKYPDLRLSQLIIGASGGDPFYIEDDQLVTLLRTFDEQQAQALGRE